MSLKDMSAAKLLGLGVFGLFAFMVIVQPEGKPQPSERDVMYSVVDKACEKVIVDRLKDPNSFKRLSYDFSQDKEKRYVADIAYTATNSFGGRVKTTYRCIFTSDKMVWAGEVK